MANIEVKIGQDVWKGTVQKVTTTPPPQPTATLKCEPASVIAGQSVTLTWTTANATSAKLDGVDVAVGANKTKKDSPIATKTYRLEATGAAGTTPAVATAAVTVTPPVPPTPPPDQPPGRRLLGGWRVRNSWAQSCIAIDFSRNKMYMPARSNDVWEFDLPAMGEGTNPANWPEVSPLKTLGTWWEPDKWGPEDHWGWPYCNGLCWWDNTLWAAPRRFYDMSPPQTTTIYAHDGRKKTINLPRQMYSGFVKRGPGQEPFLGCGGYESGQGTCSGPTLAKMDGTDLLHWAWPNLPGPNLEYWDLRCPRPDNYWPEGNEEDWWAWNPRMRNGVREGRWASDKVWSGGLVLPEGVCYWALVGTGMLAYRYQSDTFATWEMERTYKYTFDAATYKFKSFEEWPVPLLSKPHGQELDAQGRVYLSLAHAWDGGGGQADPAIFVYG